MKNWYVKIMISVDHVYILSNTCRKMLAVFITHTMKKDSFVVSHCRPFVVVFKSLVVLVYFGGVRKEKYICIFPGARSCELVTVCILCIYAL